MIGHYLTTAVNNLLKNKLFSAINIFGLALGLAAFMLIVLFVLNEHSYDRHWQDADRIYRVQQVINPPGGDEDREDGASILMLPALEQYFPDEIELGARRVNMTMVNLRVGEQAVLTDVGSVDPEFVDLFQFQVLAGDLGRVFRDTSSIALSRDIARQLFGEENPIGRTLSASSFYTEAEGEYVVRAVYEIEEGNTVFSFPALVLFGDAELTRAWFTSRQWTDSRAQTILKLSEKTDLSVLEQQMATFIDQNVVLPDWLANELPPGQAVSEVFSYDLQAVPDIYLGIDKVAVPSAFEDLGNPLLVTVFGLIAILVLLVACTNYVILTLAKSAQRSREIALRKVAGASRMQLVCQFLGESVLITLFAVFLALSLVEILLPAFETFVGKELSAAVFGMGVYVLFAFLIVGVSLVIGLFPALILARQTPAACLKEQQSSVAPGKSRLRNGLVVFQFSVSVGLMVATAVVFMQLYYVEGLNPGYNPQNLIEIGGIGQSGVRGLQETLKQEVMKLPQVKSAALSGLDPGENGGQGLVITLGYEKEGQLPGEGMGAPTLPVGFDFFRTFELPLLAGRTYESERDPVENVVLFASPLDAGESDFTGGNIILNQAASEALGFMSPDEALGETISGVGIQINDRFPFVIVGVVENTRYRSLRKEPEPEVYRLSPDAAFYLTVRYEGNAQLLLADLEGIWRDVAGDVPFNASFVGEEVAQTFNAERRQGIMVVVFAMLSILIACLGLYAMAAFTAEQRTREIGIRKVMGADLKDIIRLLLWQFSRPVLLGNLIAWPCVLWAMHSWLQRFPYQISFIWVIGLALLASCIVLICAWATVGGTAAKAANRKPVSALRYE